ncbi:Type 1 glutamine amidotransferase-like domain-containing protein [Leifsonia virtsii]|uniref:Type 1 glutamine amidotransferase-like domain-containing protein n=1 Tax=Leifsonia virtsii TaxID=3035915 RepID=A0ABT8ITW0_9MICO|nr:Type 1 glutamine amidotransferase-like domain-containing protein [Leifsonia virtsii]MDN4596143.1 Type 1 glutamine amidotransferase-like domain-containing protein [Leifsonia virtsii]
MTRDEIQEASADAVSRASLHLIGGGATTLADAALHAPFLEEAALRAQRPRPRIAVISLHPEAEEKAAALGELLVGAATGSIDLQLSTGRPGQPIGLEAIADVDGIAVGGGVVEEVRAGLEPPFGELRRLVSAGVPYLGVSAGAMIAAEGSLGGGSRIGGVVVSPEEPGEPGDELEIAAGIGLVDVAIEAHVAQRGTLSRLVAAVEAGLITGALGIDERTALIVGEGRLRVEGAGSVWRVIRTDGGVLVSTIGDAE